MANDELVLDQSGSGRATHILACILLSSLDIVSHVDGDDAVGATLLQWDGIVGR